LERRREILDADVRGTRPFLTADVGQVQVAENVQPVIDRHDDDVLFSREVRAVVQKIVAGAGREAAAVHPYHDGPALLVERRREYVDREAILALRGEAIERGDDRRRLGTARL